MHYKRVIFTIAESAVMPGEAESEPTGKKTVKSYATKVFKESSVKVISSIASTGSNPRRVFRATIFLLFTIGFLYQCVKFLAHVFTYPTVLTVDKIKPEYYMLPAYTFCNNNKVKRSKFCKKYPDRCIVPDYEFCKKNPNYCKDNLTEVPKEEFYGFPLSFTYPEEVLEFSHDLKDLFSLYERKSTEEFDGPIAREQDWLHSVPASCFSYLSRVNSSLDPFFTERQDWRLPVDLNGKLSFNPEETERFSPYSQAGVVLSIHSQFDAVNPFKKGIFLKPNHAYYISVSMSQEKLLEHPYKTDCLNYTEKWLENGKSGPRSQEMCRQACLQEYCVNCFNCSPYLLNYPSQHRYCRLELTQEKPTEDCKRNNEKIREESTLCFKDCKDECWKMKYEYRFEEKMVEKVFANGSIIDGKDEKNILVQIDFEEDKIYSYEYKAQYQEVETFSYIGGFIGIWLGVSLVELADFFESAFRITRYFFRKGSNRCLKKSTSA